MTQAEPRRYSKPLPVIHPESEPFWAALKQHELRLQQCLDCGTPRYPVSPVCYRCLSDRAEWRLMSGAATLTSWIVVERATGSAVWAEDVPYVVAFVQLAEGPRLTTNIVEADPYSLAAGMPLEIVYAEVTPEVTLPKFRPAPAPAPALQ